MQTQNKIIKNYRNLVLCYLFFLLSVGFYLSVVTNFPRFVFREEKLAADVAFFTVWGHYLSLLLLTVIFTIALPYRLYRLVDVLNKANVLKLAPFLAVLGFAISIIFPWWIRPRPLALALLALVPLTYLVFFWIISLKCPSKA